MHPSVHLELARIRQQERISRAERTRATRARIRVASKSPNNATVEPSEQDRRLR
jgi:hypothetical protein